MDSRKKFSTRLLFLCIFLFIGYLFYKNIIGSVFLKKKDRINVVFYGPTTVFYSLGRDENINYFFRPPSNLEIEVPGGYGYYRVGALGKLFSLERKKDILKKSFSSLSSSFVDLYFYPTTNTIYYDEITPQKFLPSSSFIFTNSSNANLLDRFLLWTVFLQKSSNQYKEITDFPQKKRHNRALFDREAFFKEFQGYFYKKTYRNISDHVQILYTKSYKTALLISDILEGEGIQVVDLSQTETPQNGCKIIYSSQRINDPTPKDMNSFFGCTIEKGETTISDIILILGSLEKEWSVD